MEVLNVKIDSEVIQKLDRLVKRKKFKNKSEAVRIMLNDHLEEHPELFGSADLEPVLKQASNTLSDRQFRELAAKVFGEKNKTAAEMVAEGGER
jgi:Arc/MetJ-type ribon-helix-helix transcriptional regulator